MSRKIPPIFEGSFNLEIGVLSFHTIGFERFRVPKR
jgi:hypothetical protein